MEHRTSGDKPESSKDSKNYKAKRKMEILSKLNQKARILKKGHRRISQIFNLHEEERIEKEDAIFSSQNKAWGYSHRRIH